MPDVEGAFEQEELQGLKPHRVPAEDVAAEAATYKDQSRPFMETAEGRPFAGAGEGKPVASGIQCKPFARGGQGGQEFAQ